MAEQSAKTLVLVSQKEKDSRALLERAVSVYAEKFVPTLPSFSLTKDKFGKPMVLGFACFVSVSHTAGLVIAAVSNQAVGVDAERMRTLDYAAISARFFAEKTTNQREFFLNWTGGEAIKKATDVPLTQALKDTMRTQDTQSFFMAGGYVVTLYPKGRIYIMVD